MIGREATRRATVLNPARAKADAVPAKTLHEAFGAAVSTVYDSSAELPSAPRNSGWFSDNTRVNRCHIGIVQIVALENVVRRICIGDSQDHVLVRLVQML